MERDDTIKRIRTALKRRSGKAWSVTGGRGTAWGWITIDAPPARRTWHHRTKANAPAYPGPEDYEEYDSGRPGGFMGLPDRQELGRLLGFDKPVHCQGVNIAASNAYWQEYIDRAEGRTPSVIGKPYWD